LDTLLDAASRPRSEVQRTLMLSLFFGEDEATLDRRLAWRSTQPEMKDLPLPQVVERVARGGRALVGNSEQIRAQIRAYSEAGVDELMLQWFDIDDLEGLRSFATAILPAI
jgi:alkanesulfonate monooxygenase SsuD/methylene tetrahydromethanopterin reductase-like flavin-dependent oxidoreductase (luciferase family)